MKIKNKAKFITRILELIVIIATIIITPMAIKYATALREHTAYGGEYLIPILGLLVIFILETIYEENQKNNRRK